MDTTDDLFVDPYEVSDELAAQLGHADRLITELMDRVDALEAKLACYWLAAAMNERRSA
jgi:hypothetical protein